VLLVGDLAAGFVCRLFATAATDSGVLGDALSTKFAAALGAGYGAGVNFALAIVIALAITGNYSRHRHLNGKLRLLAASALPSLFVLLALLPSTDLKGALMVCFATTGLTWAVLLADRLLTERFLSDVWPGAWGAAPTVLITDRAEGSRRLEGAVIAPGADYSLAGYVAVGGNTFDGSLGGIGDLPQIIDAHQVEAIVVCQDLTNRELVSVREASLATGCQLLYPASAARIAGASAALVWHQDQPFFELGASVLKPSAVMTKRIVDLIGASLAAICLAPVYALIAIAIKIDSPGPVFFSQDRAGLGGRRFRMLKFRTMRVGADGEKHALAHLNHSGDSRLFKIREDPRVTKLGALLRRWSVDELPQCWNVLLGDMSLVGPRPFFEADFATYQDHHFRRLDAKPGITGLWQVSGRSAVVNFEDVVYLDRQYIEQWSVWLDLSILFRTLPAVARRTGAF